MILNKTLWRWCDQFCNTLNSSSVYYIKFFIYLGRKIFKLLQLIFWLFFYEWNWISVALQIWNFSKFFESPQDMRFGTNSIIIMRKTFIKFQFCKPQKTRKWWVVNGFSNQVRKLFYQVDDWLRAEKLH